MYHLAQNVGGESVGCWQVGPNNISFQWHGRWIYEAALLAKSAARVSGFSYFVIHINLQNIDNCSPRK